MGRIADKIGKYDEVKQYDIDKQPVRNIDILKSFFLQPTLILIDELPHYLLGADSVLVGRVSLADLTVRFITDLVSVISATRNSCLILTLTEKQQLYEKYVDSLISKVKTLPDLRTGIVYDKLKDALSRQVQFTIPVSKDQAYDVIRTRLVKRIEEKERNNVIEKYFSYFNDQGLITEPEYEDKMLAAYPFHPFLIDTLYERVSTISKFNRTRGILRLLGLVLHDIYKNKKELSLVSTSDIDLTVNEIKDELTSKIDVDLRQVIDSDVIRHAQNLDSQKHIKISERIARTIYVHLRVQLKIFQRFANAVDKGELKRFLRLLIDSKNGSFEELDRAQDRYKIYPPREMAISLEIGTIEGTFNGSLALEKSWQYLALGHREINRLIQETAKPRVAALKHQTRSGILCIYKIGIIDGKGRERNGKVVGMFHSEDGKVSEVDPRSVWDYEDDSSTQNANTNFIFNSLKRIEDELKRIVDTFHIETSRKLRDIEEKTRDASIGYFANKIGQAQEKRREYERNLKEGPQFEKLISRKKTEIQNLRNESDERLSAIKREFLSHSTAELVGIGTISSDIEASIRREIEVAGMNAVLEYERKRANIEDRSKIKDVSERDCGYDIESFDRMIEVKSFKMTGFVKLTSHEWETARRLQDDYWLYVVETAFDNPTIHTIQNPYEQFKNKVKVEEIIDYRYVIEDWK